MGCVTCSSSSSRARQWETSLTVSYIEDSNMRSYSLAYYFSPVLYKTILPFYFFLSYISRRSLYISIMGGWGLCSVRTLNQCWRPLAIVISLSRNIVHTMHLVISAVSRRFYKIVDIFGEKSTSTVIYLFLIKCPLGLLGSFFLEIERNFIFKETKEKFGDYD